MIGDSLEQRCLICFDDSAGFTWPCHPAASNQDSKHIYHVFCLNNWFSQSNSVKCPSCRIDVTPLDISTDKHKISQIAKDAGIYAMEKSRKIAEITKALSYENLALISLLISKKIDLPKELWEDLIILAAKKNRLDLIKNLYAPEKPFSTDCYERCLMISLKHPTLGIFHYLISLKLELRDPCRCKVAEELALNGFWELIPSILPIGTIVDYPSKFVIIRAAIDAEIVQKDIIFYLLDSFPDEQNEARGNTARYATKKNLIDLLKELLPKTKAISSWHRGICAIEAAENHYWDLLPFFLNSKKPISHFHKISIIDEAFNSGKFEVVDFVLNSSVDFFDQTKGFAALEAAKKSLWNVVKHICCTYKTLPLESRGKIGLIAVKQSRLDVLKCLIKSKQDLTDDYVGQIVLEAVNLNNLTIVRFIFSKGFLLTTHWRSEAVVKAAMANNFVFLNYFLFSNHPISQLSRYTAAFFVAAQNNYDILCKLLPEEGSGELALSLPQKLKVSKEIKGKAVVNSAIYNRLDMIKFSFFKSGSIEEVDRIKAIEIAVGHDNIEMLKYLISFGSISEQCRRKILREAIEFDYQEIVDFLSEY